ncbi:MAG: YwqG family protein [Phycisphaerales bacterium]|jgi:hypothetical protein
MNPLERLRRLLAEKGISQQAATRILTTAQACLGFCTVREDHEERIPVGATKVGGAADLPQGAAWPAANGVNFRFIAQFDLGEVSKDLPQSPLPERGLMSFFWCQEDELGATPEGVRVLHTPDTATLVRVSDPWAAVPERVGLIRRLWGEKPSPRGQGFWPCRVELSLKVTIPDPNGPRGIGEELVSKAEFDMIYGGGLEKELAAAGVLDVGHRLLGEACPIQGPVEFDAQWDRNKAGSEDEAAQVKAAAAWRLLLQVIADDAPEFGFGDLGSIYFMIREVDLVSRRWDQVRVVMQCH